MRTAPAAGRTPLTPGRRERKKSEQRRILQRAALRLANELGYKQLTVEAIAEAADVSPRTFFNYFPSKDEALLSPGPDVLREFVAAVIGRPVHEPALTAVRFALQEAARQVDEDLELWQARMRVVEANPQLWARLASSFFMIERALAVAVGRRLGTDPRRDPYTVLLAACATSAMRNALMQWRLSPERPVPDRLDELLDLMAGGLIQPPAPALVRADPDASPDDLLVDVDDPALNSRDSR